MAKVAGLRGAVVALAVVAGLFAMHGLSQHGDHVPTTAHAGHAAEDSIALSAVVAPLAVTVLASDPAPGPQDHDGSGALALCLTVLVAVCLTLWATARPRGVLRTLSRAVTSAPRPPVRARAPDPPGRWALSVCRC